MTETIVEALRHAPMGDAAVVDPLGVELSHAEFLEGAEMIAGQLAALGVGPGVTAATVLSNGVASAQVYIGTLGAGRAAPINPNLTHKEIIGQLSGVGAHVLITSPERVAELSGLPIDVPVLAVEPATTGYEITDRGRPVPMQAPAPITGTDGALVLLTSGTTGDPKRVSLTHSNLLHAVASIVSTLALGEGDCGLLLMPQFHVHGLQAGLLAPLVAGGRVVIPNKFDARAVPRQCLSHDVTWYTAVPTMHGLIADRAVRRDRSWTGSIRFVRTSSAPMPPTLHTQVESLLEAPLLEAYGMTECAHQIASNPLPPANRAIGTVGAATGVEIRIADERDDGRGEVLVRGDSVIAAYEAVDPGVNARAFPDGWFRTGDEGRIDKSGTLSLTGRLKELINRGGEKIRPQEVEDVIATHPGVKDVAVFAIPHARLGEDVAAAVVPSGTAPTPRDLREHARHGLAAFKVPQTIQFVEAIPCGPTGKVQRSRLATQLDIS